MNKKPINRALRAAAVLLVLVLFTSRLSAGMMARYRVTSSGGDGARVARFDVEREGTLLVDGIDISIDPTSGTVKCAELTVTNKSETAICCTPTLQTTGNLPVSYFWSTDPNGQAQDKVLTDIRLAPNATDAVQFYLFVRWSEEAQANSYMYHSEIDHVQVTLVCEQID